MTGANRWWLVGAGLLLVLLALTWLAPSRQTPPIAYTALGPLISEGKVAEVELRGRDIVGRFTEPQPVGPDHAPTKSFQTRVPDFGSPGILRQLEAKGVPVHVLNPNGGGWGAFAYLLPWLLIIGVWVWMSRRAMRQGGGMYGGLGQLARSRLKRVKPEASKTRFDDIAGQDAAKRDVAELVEFLKDRSRFEKLGADVPHGVLLYGPPGTGKTLMARALAGEAGVPFFHTSGSEFIEMVVGVGASRVRQMFEEAKKHQPSILFIDEIDAVGRQRGAGVGGGHDEREQTLNQILSEMDGFTEKQAVVVVAATNRPDVLDKALLRPGRFDRRLAMERPDRKARVAILGIHTRNVPLADDVDLETVAAGTPGFSGADLKNLVNEAAILAAREGATQVDRPHFDEARDKVMMGASRPLTFQPDERHRLAVHEIGHTAVAFFLPNADPPTKVTIVPRGQALGGTQQLPEAERYVMQEDYLRDRLAVLLAGRAAEQVFMGNVSSGADDDISRATRIARAMVARWGMSKEIGPVDLRESDDHPFLGLEMTRQRSFSEETAHEVDTAVRKLLNEASGRATALIERHRPAVEALVADLEAHETLDAERIRQALESTPEPAAAIS